MFKAAYTVVAVKKSNVWDDASFLTEHSELIPSYYAMTPITCERIWKGETVLIPGFSDYQFSITGKVLKSIGNSEKDIEYSQKLSRTFMKGGKHKGSEYIYPVEWINPKGEKLLGNVLINGEVFIGIKFCDTIELSDGTWLKFRDPFGEWNTAPLGPESFEIDLVQYMVERSMTNKTKVLVFFDKDNEASIVSIGTRKYLVGNVNSTKKFVFQLTFHKNNTRIVRTNHRSIIFMPNSTNLVTTKSSEFLFTDKDLYLSHIDNLFMWGYQGMLENLQQIELQACRIDNLRQGNVLAMTGNGDAHSVFFENQNLLGLHAEKAGGLLYVHRCAKVLVEIITLEFCTEEVPVQMIVNGTALLRFMDPISRVLYRNFTLSLCNPLYPNALNLRNGSWLTYGNELKLMPAPEKFQTHKLTVNWTKTSPGIGIIDSEQLKMSKIAQMVKHSKKNYNRKGSLPGK